MTKVARELPDSVTDRFLSYHQVAELRGVSVDTVKRQVKRGEIAKVQLSPRRVGIRLSEAMKSTARVQ